MKHWKTAVLLPVLLLLLPACGAGAGETAGGGLTPVSICLEWTPNTNHTGLYAALSLGYFQEEGLDVQILQPPEDGASALCAAGRTEFAVTAQDTLAAALSREEPGE